MVPCAPVSPGIAINVASTCNGLTDGSCTCHCLLCCLLCRSVLGCLPTLPALGHAFVHILCPVVLLASGPFNHILDILQASECAYENVRCQVVSPLTCGLREALGLASQPSATPSARFGRTAAAPVSGLLQRSGRRCVQSSTLGGSSDPPPALSSGYESLDHLGTCHAQGYAHVGLARGCR